MVPNLLERTFTAARRHHVRGTDRVLRALRGNNFTYPIRTTTVDGMTFLAEPTDWADRAVLMNGFFEREVFDALRPQLRPGDVLWDIGANTGIHGLSLARLLPVRVVCFEPSPFTFCRLVANARANRLDDVRLLNIALSNRAGYATLDVCLAGNTGTTSLVPDTVHGGERMTMSCRLETAASVIEQGLAPAPTVLKIDVEGHDLEVLEGFGALLSRPGIRAVVIEGDRAHALLEATGFRVTELPKANVHDNLTPNYLAVR